MKIYRSDQTKNFKTHLEELKLQDVIPYDRSQLKEKMTLIDIKTNKDIQQLGTNFFWDYNIFQKTL